MSSNKEQLISVIIPTYNRGKILLDTVHQFLEQSYRNFELIIVDQTDNDEYRVADQISGIRDKRIRLFVVSPNSLPAARNYGLEKAQGDIVIFVDDDIRIKPSFIQQHIKEFVSEDIVAVAGSVTQKGHPQYDFVAYFDKYGMQHGLFNAKRAMDCTTFPGGNVSLRKSAVLQVGGFDVSYSGSSIREESDLAYRLNKVGRIRYQPKANIVHLAVPFGGCRIYKHQYNNLQFYYNNFRFILKTVSLRLLPGSFLRCYKNFCFAHKHPAKIVLRTSLFIVGLCIALKRLIIPLNVVLTERES